MRMKEAGSSSIRARGGRGKLEFVLFFGRRCAPVREKAVPSPRSRLLQSSGHKELSARPLRSV